ncbi:MAG: hypothetical protein C4335_02500 [Armatimonadota bacterium]
MSNPATAPEIETLAQAYLRATVANALLRFTEPAKMLELHDACGLPAMDMDILRYVLGSNSDIFTSTERRWTVAARFEDRSRPVHALVESLLRHTGQPIALESLAYLLADIYQRSPHSMAVVIYRLSETHFFRLPGNRIGLRDWLLRTDYDSVADVAFYNYIDLAAAQELLDKHPSFEGSPQSVLTLVEDVGAPLSSRFVAFLQWLRDPESFDAVKAYQNLLNAEGLVSVPLKERDVLEPVTHWASAKWVPQWIDTIRPKAKQMAGVLAQLMAEPLVLSVEDVEGMVQRVLQSPKVVTAEELAQRFFDLTPSDPTYANDLDTITQSLRQDARIMWLGGTRFVNPQNLPPYLFEVPESLRFPEVQFYTEEGEPLEIDLEDEGLSGTLRSDIMDPVAQDVGDEEEEKLTIFPIPESVQCVVKARHKEIGTFPLCQIPQGFFQAEPDFQQITLIDETTGERYTEVYVNQTERLIYGLLDWYATRDAVSGLIFTLTRTEHPFVFKVRWEETLDQRVHLSRSRYEELLDMSTRMVQTYSTFDIICEILSHRGGMEFLNILSEVNVIRRTRRRRVASVLSAFQAFYLRGGLWHLDERKRDAGIDRTKRKHIRK